ncbi:MAG: hypothetical protein HFI38_03115 [Lachnospiraceae bacterium]|nr:hypothetical protein [Lachnospiraceae bacterium]
MKYKLIIDGNAVYEIDGECASCQREREEEMSSSCAVCRRSGDRTGGSKERPEAGTGN